LKSGSVVQGATQAGKSGHENPPPRKKCSRASLVSAGYVVSDAVPQKPHEHRGGAERNATPKRLQHKDD
jgi:hypothetical protein